MSLDGLIITDQRLGEGGFGSVFVCKLGEKKVAAKKLSQSEEEFSNLLREASRLKRVRHGKHIAYTYGIAMKEESMYMVMEYSECGDLQNYLIRNKESVTYEQKILFCRGILLGLLYCHSMKIFHGDIKCSNVILGKNLVPKLTDFGLSITVDNIEYYSELYKGSLYWAAPELFSIKEDKTVYREFIANPYPCDVYSLGATFCEISYDGTTRFIDSNDPGTDVMLGIVFPLPKDQFLEEVISFCCCYERSARIALDTCLVMLDITAEEELSDSAIADKWQEIQQDIRVNSKLELLPSFILRRPAENLVVGPSNLSLMEWLCINNCVDTIKYMIQLHKHDQDQDQIKWLHGISKLCESPEVANFLQSLMQNSKPSRLRLSNLIDSNPQQFVEILIEAGATFYSYNLLKKAIEKHYNMVVQAIIDRRNNFKNWAIHDAVKFGNAEAVKILANAGADLERKDDYNGDTPLITAIESEKVEIVKILLKLGVGVHNESRYSWRVLVVRIPRRPLYLAALMDNREIVKLLIDAGATMYITSSEWHSLSQSLEQRGNISMVHFIGNEINKKSSSVESSSLCAAIRNKQPDLVQTLIDNGANIDEIGVDGYAPLHWAVIVDNKEIVRILVRTDVNLDVRTLNEAQNFRSTSALDYFSECTPLHIAVSKGCLGIAKLLIKLGADFSAKNGLQQTVIEIAAEQDKKILEEVIRECAPVNAISIQRILKLKNLESIKAIIEDQQIDTETRSKYLCTTASSNKNDLIKYLLNCRVDISNEYQGKTPLEWAMFGENIQAVKTLVNSGVHVNAKNIYGRIPLIQFVTESNTDMIQFLMDKGADVNARNEDGYAPIHYAKNKETMRILINAGADINAKDVCGRISLIRYVRKSNAEMVQFLVDKGADVNARDNNGYAPIHYANDKEVMRILINAGVDVNAKGTYRRTLLTEYVRKSNAEMVQFLVDKGADVNHSDEDGKTPIHYANDREIVRILINAGADVNAEDGYGRTPFIEYVIESDTEMVQFLIDKGADVNARDKNGKAPIHYAKDKEIMKILINAGADVNAKDVYKRTPLIRHVIDSNAEMVQFLVDKGADVNARDNNGFAPIHYANDKEIVKILINAGVDTNSKNKYERTPLIRHVIDSNTEMIQFLIDKGADVNARDNNGYAPIHYANDKEIVKILINAGVDANAEDGYGIASLIQFVIESNAEMVQFLVDKGANVNARDEDGYAPIHYAKNKETMRILINAGADINAKDVCGRISLIRYVRKSNAEMVQFLVDKGADVNARDNNGYAPIHYANDKEVMRTLINAGVDANAEDGYEIASLIQSVIESNAEMVQFLVDKGADVNARDNDGYAPIHYANDKEIVRILINAGVDVNAKDVCGRMPLIRYVRKSSAEIVWFLIDKGADLNARDNNGYAPIHYANDKEIMKILINAGADVNAKDVYKRTPLIRHVIDSNAEMVQFLVDKGEDVNSSVKNGFAPVHYANDKEIMKILINAGADVNAKDVYKKTPLIRNVIDSNAEIVRFLIYKGADVNARDKNGKAPIHYAKDKEIVKILINAGVDVNVEDGYGRTLLTGYVRKSNAEMVQFLVDKGADVNHSDEDGKIPIHYANDREIVRILINAGANVNAEDGYGRTPFIEYVIELDTEMVQFLIDKGADVNASDKYGNASIHFVRDKEIAEILITAGADVKVKDRHGKRLFDILIEE